MRRTAARRLVRALPDVFVGADAAATLDGRRGFLYGEKRHRQVDILGFEPAVDRTSGTVTLETLVERRLDRSAIGGWRIVGLAVCPADLEHGQEALLLGLVAGDIVLAAQPAPETACGETTRPRKGGMRILVHRGDSLADVNSRS